VFDEVTNLWSQIRDFFLEEKTICDYELRRFSEIIEEDLLAFSNGLSQRFEKFLEFLNAT